MRYRRLSPTGDYTFGQGGLNFLVDSPECVGQSVQTRLRLWLGEWFLDATDGTPWSEKVLGERRQATWDAAVRDRVLATDGVASIDAYESSLDSAARRLTYSMTVTTRFGVTTVSDEVVV